MYILFKNIINTDNNIKYNKKRNNIDFNIYVINLIKNKDKLETFFDSYYKSDLSNKDIIVYPAVIGKDLELMKYVSSSTYNDIIMTETNNVRENHTKFTRGAIGCYLSHLNIIKKIAESDKNYGIIFEDDAIIHPYFYDILIKKLDNIPNDWDILLLGGICMDGVYYDDYIDIKNFYGTECYIIKKESAIKLVPVLDKLIDLQIDAELVKLNKNKYINIYQIYPVLVYQNTTPSDIQINTKYTKENIYEYFKILKNVTFNYINQKIQYN
jgi:GR25 family glycosyltransferase involved in LPS biosynthesis